MKLKAAIITIHVGKNFGSVLQTIATQNILKQVGVDPIIVDYKPNRVLFSRYLQEALKTPKSFLHKLLFLPVYLKFRHVFATYLKKTCNLTKQITAKDEFSKVCPIADFYITGSDQVWNSYYNEGFDDRYFWAGINHGTKIAFSSSIGKTKIDENEAVLFKKYLKDFKAISVREKSAQMILSDLGLKAEHILDPTFLLSKENWIKYIKPLNFKAPYLLLYLPYNIKDLNMIIESAKFLANKYKLKILTFGLHNNYADKTIRFADPGDFLTYMYYADYVITNSFHGTAFSINLNKQFWVYHPSAFSTRIDSILQLTNLNDRLLSKVIEEKNLDLIDYVPVNSILNHERSKAEKFLKDNIFD